MPQRSRAGQGALIVPTRSSPTKPSLASRADKYALYETSVQTPQGEVEFIDRTFRRLRGRAPRRLREDFCGSANVASAWVKHGRDRTAVGIDLDPKVLAWAHTERLSKLGASVRERIELRQQDVVDPTRGRFDVCVAYNYSSFVFRTREAMRRYFRAVHKTLVQDGMFYLDAFGGSLAQQTSLEQRKLPGFLYLWEQERFNPIDSSITCHIHFLFDDRSKLERAFTYHWRLWSLAELRELLAEAGFARSLVYWEDTDEHGNHLARFRERTRAESLPAWNAYILALK